MITNPLELLKFALASNGEQLLGNGLQVFWQRPGVKVLDELFHDFMPTLDMDDLGLSKGSCEEFGPCLNDGFVNMNLTGVISGNDCIRFADGILLRQSNLIQYHEVRGRFSKEKVITNELL